LADSNEFLSMHFSLWGIGKSHRGLNPVNRGSFGVQECTYHLKIASPRGHCELTHCLDAESTISSSVSPTCQSFFNFTRNFRLIALLNFHLSHERGRETQHGHIQTKLRGNPTDIQRRVQSCSI
jgi:hypothetical protein